MNCNICEIKLTKNIYNSESTKSLTSLCTLYDGPTQVFFCQECGHVQSVEIANIDEYYKSDYDILVESEEEDQIYEMINGQPLYRTEHQVSTLLKKIDLPSGTKILDYGCAKSSTMRELKNRNPKVEVHLFDVSERYISFWRKFLSEDHWETYVIPSAWDGMFDVVTSFFSLEHMAHPQDALRQIFRVTKMNGIFYGVIPNVFSNTADMVVVDHVNHFTAISLTHLLHNNGFEVIELDDVSHRGALVFKARKVKNLSIVEEVTKSNKLQDLFKKVNEVAKFWQDIGAKVKDFELSIQNNDQVAIYGAGFYGAFITSCLKHPEKISFIIDQSPFLQGRKVNGITVIPPNELPQEIKVVLVGFNPAHARRLINEISEFSNRQLTFFFL